MTFSLRYAALGALMLKEGLLGAPCACSFKDLTLEQDGNQLLRGVSGLVNPGWFLDYFDSPFFSVVQACQS